MQLLSRLAPAQRSVVWLLGVAIFALAIASASGTVPARAAPLAGTFKYSMRADRSRSTVSLCVGERVDVYVTVRRTDSSFWGTHSQAVTGISIEATVQNPRVGAILPARNTTGWDIDNAGAAHFVFTARAPGETPVAFTGTITQHWLGTRLVERRDTVEDAFGAKVIACKFKLTSISRGKYLVNAYPGPAYLHLSGISSVVLEADEQGNYAGSGEVIWGTSIDAREFRVPGGTVVCHDVVKTEPSQVDWKGQMDDDGFLVLTGTFQPTTTTATGPCAGEVMDVVPDPLKLRVYPSDGGVATKPQEFQGSSQIGSAFIAVSRE